MAIENTISGITNSSVLTIDPNATASCLSDEISAKLSHLEAMTCTIYGGGFESFNAYNDTIKENYLWAISHQLGEVKALFEAFCAAPNGEANS